MKKFMIVTGTRPEIIKVAPLYEILRARGEEVILVHSGQHEAVAESLYRFFGIIPSISIALQRKSSSLSHLNAALFDGMENAFGERKVDSVIVQGDTTTALVASLAAYYHDLPVAHVEAGLRTWEREPFPEEKNRELISRIAYWHFAPTSQAYRNLIKERVAEQRIYQVGNTVIDAAYSARRRLAESPQSVQSEVVRNFLASRQGRPFILVTAHRRENWGQPIRDIVRALLQVVQRNPEVGVVWPLHPNPAVRHTVEEEVAAQPKALQAHFCLDGPASYPALIDLLERCSFTLTDSGGIQEEASAFGKPVLIARLSTERQELVQAGGALLVGTEVETIVEAACALLDDQRLYQSMCLPTSPFGDGHASDYIADVLLAN
jgi:UDP-N-acetylglucosamine 2-epimerase